MNPLITGLLKIFIFILLFPFSILFSLISKIQKLGGAEKTANDIILEKIKALTQE